MNKMQNFDIENLERKNIYNVPEDLFSKMQHNVLMEVQQPKAVIRLGLPAKSRQPWQYAVAAAVVFLFGMMFWLNAGNEAPAPTLASTHPETLPKTTANPAQIQVENTVASAEVNIEKNEKSSAAHLTKQKIEHPNYTRAVAKSGIQAPKISQTNAHAEVTEVQFADEVIHSLTNDELSDLTSLAENDVYLDLYY